MDLDPLLLSRIQFAFVVSFHIIFPAFTIGLAAWLATIEGMRLATGNPVYRRVFEFWRARAKPSAPWWSGAENARGWFEAKLFLAVRDKLDGRARSGPSPYRPLRERLAD
jgi:hypothetical protein